MIGRFGIGGRLFVTMGMAVVTGCVYRCNGFGAVDPRRSMLMVRTATQPQVEQKCRDGYQGDDKAHYPQFFVIWRASQCQNILY